MVLTLVSYLVKSHELLGASEICEGPAGHLVDEKAGLCSTGVVQSIFEAMVQTAVGSRLYN